MDPSDLERIARTALRELGAGDPPVTISQDERPDSWVLDVGGPIPLRMKVRAGSGTTAQFVRQQIFDQYSTR